MKLSGIPWWRRLVTYATGTFKLDHWLRQVKDHRPRAQIPVSTVVLALLTGFLLRVPSFNELEYRLRYGRLGRLLPGPRMPSADTLGYTLERLDLETLLAMHVAVLRQAHRNKALALGGLGGRRVVAFDGSEVYRSTQRCCPTCIREHKQGRVYYVHKVVAALRVDRHPKVLLGITRQRPGEGEQGACRRLREDLWQQLHHFADVVVLDALYASYGVLEWFVAHDMEVIITLKNENYDLLQDAEGLFAQQDRPACETRDPIVRDARLQIWEESNFLWGRVQTRLRVAKWRVLDPLTGELVRGPNLLLTTLTVGQVNAELLVTMMRKRWEIENAGFRELKQAWHLDHMYHHHPVALDALWLVLCVAVNLFLIWYHRQVAWRYRGQLQSVSHFIVLLQGELWATDVTGEAWLVPT